MDTDQIIKLMKAVSESGIAEFEYEENGVALRLKKQSAAEPLQAPVQAAEPIAPAAKAPQLAETGNVIKSPLVGIFYSAGSPDEEDYVKIGDTVRKGQVIGIVEAMKLMNEIESEFDGTVKEILVKNGDLVGFDQPMFIIES